MCDNFWPLFTYMLYTHMCMYINPILPSVSLHSVPASHTMYVLCIPHVDTFIQTLSSGGGPIDLYSSLLKLLLPEEDPNRAVVDQTLVPLSKGVCNRILREYVAECVSDESAPPKLLDNFPPKSTQDHLAIAIFLVGEVLLQVRMYVRTSV